MLALIGPHHSYLPSRGNLPRRGDLPRPKNLPHHGDLPHQGNLPHHGDIPHHGAALVTGTSPGACNSPFFIKRESWLHAGLPSPSKNSITDKVIKFTKLIVINSINSYSQFYRHSFHCIHNRYSHHQTLLLSSYQHKLV